MAVKRKKERKKERKNLLWDERLYDVIGNFIEALVEHESLLFVTCGHGRLVGFQLLDDLTAVDFGPFTTSQPLLELSHFRFSCSQSRLSFTQPLLFDKRKERRKTITIKDNNNNTQVRVNMQFSSLYIRKKIIKNKRVGSFGPVNGWTQWWAR